MTERRMVGFLLTLHAVLVAACAVRYSFSWTEGRLLAAGIIDWQYGNFDVFRVSPPLVRMWSSWPLVLGGVEAPFGGASPNTRIRAEWPTTRAFIDLHGEASLVYLSIARLMCLPFSLLGAWIAYRWSRDMFGRWAGLGALLLWTCMPQLIGYGAQISGDAQAAAMGLVTFYVFRDELLLLTPLVLILTLASAETGLNRHVRYVLPILPPAIVFVSRAFLVFDGGRRWPRWLVAGASMFFVVSSLTIYPHSISYFNELIGGPRNAIEHMNASNLDWGQDLRFLRDWARQHPEARPLYTDYYARVIDPAKVGVPTAGEIPRIQPTNLATEPLPVGWYAIDQESLLGRHGAGAQRYKYLKELEPVARVGYSFLIYHIDQRTAERLQEQNRERNDAGEQ